MKLKKKVLSYRFQDCSEKMFNVQWNSRIIFFFEEKKTKLEIKLNFEDRMSTHLSYGEKWDFLFFEYTIEITCTIEIKIDLKNVKNDTESDYIEVANLPPTKKAQNQNKNREIE